MLRRTKPHLRCYGVGDRPCGGVVYRIGRCMYCYDVALRICDSLECLAGSIRDGLEDAEVEQVMLHVINESQRGNTYLAAAMARWRARHGFPP